MKPKLSGLPVVLLAGLMLCVGGCSRLKERAEDHYYKVEWLDHAIPPTLVAGQEYLLPVSMRNTSPAHWMPNGGILVTYHVYDEKRLQLLEFAPLVTPLRETAAPGQAVDSFFLLRAPQEPGVYSISVDMAHHEMTFFERHGSPPLWVKVTVVEEV